MDCTLHLSLGSHSRHDLYHINFIRSFKRFNARRGLPVLLISDNGKTFEAAARIIKAIVTSKEV